MARRAAEKDDAGQPVRIRMIREALRHFAEKGYEGASLRAIHRDVGVNPATTHYHFGSKAALYTAVIESYLGRILAERTELLEELVAKGRPTLRDLLSAYVAPHIRIIHEPGGEDYGRLIARAVLVPSSPRPSLVDRLAPVRARYVQQLRLCFPDTPALEVARALSFTAILMATAPFDQGYRSMTGETPLGKTPEDMTRRIVDFACAGFDALCRPAPS